MDQRRTIGPPSSEMELVERLTGPTPDALDSVRSLDGDMLVLGAGGKIGPSFALLAHRCLAVAGSRHRVICVSRFTDAGTAMTLGRAGIRTIAADLLDRKALERLPDSPVVYYLAGTKFGTAASPAHTWAINALMPALVAERYRAATIVALSSGNIYPFVPTASAGAPEETPPAPVGDYAQSCLARERMFEYVSSLHGTRVLLVRLNYATDLRYGVLLDLAQKIALRAPIDLTMGYFNTVWQGDVSRLLLCARTLAASPPAVLNVTGPDVVSVRSAAIRLASLMELPEPEFAGTEHGTALLSDAGRCWSLFDGPLVSTNELIEWTAQWVRTAGTVLDRPTHFDVRDGQY